MSEDAGTKLERTCAYLTESEPQSSAHAADGEDKSETERVLRKSACCMLAQMQEVVDAMRAEAGTELEPSCVFDGT